MTIFIICLILCIVLFFMFARYIKPMKIGNLTLISGGVKKGKSFLSIAMVYKVYNRNLFKWRLKCLKCFLTRKPRPVRPCLYSNVPIGNHRSLFKKYREYVPLTLDIISMKERQTPLAVTYINEASLVSGSKDIRDEEINDAQLHYYKLYAHLTEGGTCIIDTQSPMDLHYTLKRSLSNYYNIIDNKRFPFFSVLGIREQILVDGEHSQTIINEDVDDAKHEGLKPLYVMPLSHRWWRFYDRYAYSVLVSEKPLNNTIVKTTKNKKTNKLIRFKNLKK